MRFDAEPTPEPKWGPTSEYMVRINMENMNRALREGNRFGDRSFLARVCGCSEQSDVPKYERLSGGE